MQQNAFMQSMKTIAQSLVNTAGFDKTRTGTIIAYNEISKTYTVKVDGITYNNVKCTNDMIYGIGDIVKLNIPMNNPSQIYITGSIYSPDSIGNHLIRVDDLIDQIDDKVESISEVMGEIYQLNISISYAPDTIAGDGSQMAIYTASLLHLSDNGIIDVTNQHLNELHWYIETPTSKTEYSETGYQSSPGGYIQVGSSHYLYGQSIVLEWIVDNVVQLRNRATLFNYQEIDTNISALQTATSIATDQLQYFWFNGNVASATDKGVHITLVTKSVFENNPTLGGKNVLITTNGFAMRDGLDTLAYFAADSARVGALTDAYIEIDNGDLRGGYNSLPTFIIDTNGVDDSEIVAAVSEFYNLDTVREIDENSLNYTYLNETFTVNITQGSTTETMTWTKGISQTFTYNNLNCIIIYDGNIAYYIMPISGTFTGEVTLNLRPHIPKVNFTFGTRKNSNYGDFSFAVGLNNIVKGKYSCTFGSGNTVENNYSYAEGLLNDIDGNYSHAEGYRNFVYGNYSHAEGYRNFVYGNYSHAEGHGGYISSNADYAHVQNLSNEAFAKAQTVIGTYNLADTIPATAVHPNGDVNYGNYAFIIGNGTSGGVLGNRSNALTVDWNGLICTYQVAQPSGSSSPYFDNGLKVINNTTNYSMLFGIGSGGQNRGIYDDASGWMIYKDSSNNTHIPNGVSISGALTVTSGGANITGSVTSSTRFVSAYMYNNTIATDNRVAITSNGTMGRYASSSRRYKKDIKNSTFDPHNLYKLKARQFRYKDGYFSADSDDPHAYDIQVGFIAEEVNKCYPMATVYDGDKIESWSERKIIPPMLTLIQELNDRLTKAEKQLKLLKK